MPYESDRVRVTPDVEDVATTGENGEWGMGSGECGMGNVEWGMWNGEWGVASIGGRKPEIRSASRISRASGECGVGSQEPSKMPSGRGTFTFRLVTVTTIGSPLIMFFICCI